MKKNPKECPLQLFGTVRLFSPKGSLLQFFDILRQWMLKNPNPPFLAHPFGPTFGFFSSTVEENILHFEVLFLFLSLRYGADLCHRRLVSLKSNRRRVKEDVNLFHLGVVETLPLVGGPLHVGAHAVFDGLHSSAEQQGALGLPLVHLGGGAADDHGRLRVPAQGVLENTNFSSFLF